MNYEVSFIYKNQEIEFSNNRVATLYIDLCNWLYKNGYKFQGEIHNAFIRKPFTKEEAESILSKNYSGNNFYQIFFNIEGSEIYLYRGGNINKIYPNILKMLKNFGIDEKTIETTGFEQLSNTSNRIKKVSDMEAKNDLTPEIERTTFVNAAQIVLNDYENTPMSAEEIWEEIELRNIVDTKGSTPKASLNTILLKYSDNSNVSKGYKKKIFTIVSTNPNKFKLINNNVQNIIEETENYFLLGAYSKDNPDWWKQCVEEGKWYNGFALGGDSRLDDKVNEIPVGANVAIKSTYTKERTKPAMMVKARGVVTKNYGDGTKLDVEWEPDFTPFEMVRNDVGGYRATLHQVTNQEHIDLIWNLDGKGDGEEKEVMSPYDFFTSTTGGKSVYTMKDEPSLTMVKPDKYDIKLTRDIENTKEIEKSSESSNYELNPFRQAICVLGESGAGKSTSIYNILTKEGHNSQFIIPSASTTGLLSQFSPRENGYIQSRLGKMIEDAWQNPDKLYTAVFDECHKTNTIEMINDELLQAISIARNLENRFISLDEDTAKLYKKSKKDDSGNIKIPDNFGFIFISSKPEIFRNNPDFFNRVDLLEITEGKRPKTIEELNSLRKKTKSDKIGLLSMLDAKRNQLD